MDYVSMMLGSLKSDNRAVTAVEYALMAGLIALAIVVAVQGLAGGIEGVMNSVSSAL